VSTAHITITYIDPDREALKFRAPGFMGLGDRYAFEERFGLSSANLAPMGTALQQMAEALEKGDVSSEELQLRETWYAFFVWRAAKRWIPGTLEFEDWIDAIDDLEVDERTAEQRRADEAAAAAKEAAAGAEKAQDGSSEPARAELEGNPTIATALTG
jgi:hypothetical protein